MGIQIQLIFFVVMIVLFIGLHTTQKELDFLLLTCTTSHWIVKYKNPFRASLRQCARVIHYRHTNCRFIYTSIFLIWQLQVQNRCSSYYTSRVVLVDIVVDVVIFCCGWWVVFLMFVVSLILILICSWCFNVDFCSCYCCLSLFLSK